MTKDKSKITITRSKGGTKERKTPIEEVHIPDLWHVGNWHKRQSGIGGLDKEMHQVAGQEILECWHLCHDLLRELREVKR